RRSRDFSWGRRRPACFGAGKMPACRQRHIAICTALSTAPQDIAPRVTRAQVQAERCAPPVVALLQGFMV
ncbi:MAG TPA: hypothetical protein V6D08_13460, partial [Candidatus Obscuribacterales bacterium]